MNITQTVPVLKRVLAPAIRMRRLVLTLLINELVSD